MTRADSVAEIPAAAISKRPSASARIQRLAILPHPAYARLVKTILLCLAATLVLSIFAGCASGKKKSSARLYEGDSSPNIKMFEENPGGPLNPM